MGMLGKLFGRGENYPPLPQDDQAMASLDELHTELETLTHKVREHLEIVPAQHEAYIFLGKPPKHFGIAWVHDGKVSSLKELIDENHLTPVMVEQLIDALRQAYQHASEAPRYSAHIGDKDVVVILSKGLEQEVHQIFEQKLH